MANRAKYLLAEGLLIVISILIAFAIDAWWAERQDRTEERRILESLKAEFQANAETIPEFIDEHQRSARYTTALARTMNKAGPGGSFGINTADLAQVIQHRSTDPQRGALDAILQSGELRYISNPKIRQRLAGWPRLVVDATENETLLRTQWGPMLFEASAKNADLSPFQDMDLACWGDPTLEQCQTSQVTLNWNTEIIGYLNPVSGYTNEAARELGLLVEEANNIVALIDQELTTL